MPADVKLCSKCEKTVYSVEELKCLDKLWHKKCFKCTTCNTPLNMKNYKGFDKQPYCYVHYPQQKHTQVADNPELLRIKENTKIQSNIKYHEDFEKSKGAYTSISDDPETLRILENSKIISQAKYHEDFERNIKNKYPQSVDTNSLKRTTTATTMTATTANYKDHSQTLDTRKSSSNRASNVIGFDAIASANFANNCRNETTKLSESLSNLRLQQQQSTRLNGVTNNSLGRQQQQQQQYQSEHFRANVNTASSSSAASSSQRSPTDSTLSNADFNSQNSLIMKNILTDAYRHDEIKTSVYKAVYDYDAKEDDEISFRDGDRFINCEQIDVGWMIGVHEKTRRHGLFPANYVEPIDFF